jgi:hypothetical protein
MMEDLQAAVQTAVINERTANTLVQLQREIEFHNTSFRDFLVEQRDTNKDHEKRIRNVEGKIYMAVGAVGVATSIVTLAVHFWK